MGVGTTPMAYAQSLEAAAATDAAEAPIALKTPRAAGAVSVAAKRRGERTALARFRQSGSAKALFPRPTARTARGQLDAVLLNTAGGVTGGDRFTYEATAEDGAWLRLSTQAAERGYRAKGGEVGRISVRMRAGVGARLDWLPQETILFDGAALERHFTVDLAETSRFLAVEPLVFGRRAMGERVRRLRLIDHWRITSAGRLLYADALRLIGDAAELLERPGVASGRRALATVVYIGADAATRLDHVRAALTGEAGASSPRPGVLVIRLLAPDSFLLRQALIPALAPLCDAPLPKVWTL